MGRERGPAFAPQRVLLLFTLAVVLALLLLSPFLAQARRVPTRRNAPLPAPAPPRAYDTPWLPVNTSPPGRRSHFVDPRIPDPLPYPAVKLVVTEEGLYAVTPDMLREVPGFDPDADPRTFRLIRRGQEVAIWVAGEEDGAFDTADRILFYGQPRPDEPMFTKYGDEEVYWLTWGGPRGRRVTTLDASPVADTRVVTSTRATLRLEEDREWFTHHSLDFPTRDTWWWARVQAPGKPATVTLRASIPAPEPGTTATLRYELAPRTWVNPHRVQVRVNGTLVDDRTFNGHTLHVFTATVPAGVLGQDLALSLTAFPVPNLGAEDLYLNGFDITYTRGLTASENALLVPLNHEPPYTLRLTGFTSPNVHVWDVSTPDTPRRLTNARVSTHNAHPTLTLGVRAPISRLLAVADAELRAPEIRAYRPTSLRAHPTGADLIIITSEALMAPAQRLADYRRSQGYRVAVVDVAQLYDEFAWGWRHPEAIRAFLAYAYAQWPRPAPRYVLLLGSGHWNVKGLNTARYGPLPPNHVPPYLAWVDPWQGEVPVDQAYVTVAGNDDLPDMVVGRIPARTADEATAVVEKIIAYEARGWDGTDAQRRFLVVADNPDASGDFHALADVAAAYRPPWARVTPIYLGRTHDADAARAALRDHLNAGAALVSYQGHGAIDRWAHERLFTAADADALRNRTWPLVVTFNCLDGYFAYPSTQREALAARMLRQPGVGSIAAWSPAGLGTTWTQDMLQRALWDALFVQGESRLGDATHRARLAFYRRVGPDAIFFTQTLFGDPLLRLAFPRWQALPYVPLATTP